MAAHLRKAAGAVHQAVTAALPRGAVWTAGTRLVVRSMHSAGRASAGAFGRSGLPAGAVVGQGLGGVRMLADYAGAQPLGMPALSPTMEVGTITSWEKQPGDELAPGDTICEIETDKATVALESTEDGFLAKHLVPAGTTDIPIGTPIALLVEEASEVEAIASATFPDPMAEAAAAPAPASAPAPAPAPAKAPVKHSVLDDPTRFMPAARRVLLEAGSSGEGITGTGHKGRVTKGDALVFLGHAPATSLPAPPSASAPAPAQGTGGARATPGGPVHVGAGVVVEGGKLHMPGQPHPTLPGPADRAGGTWSDSKPSSMRKVISKRLTESKITVPHFYVQGDCTVDAVTALRAELKAAGVKVSMNDLVIKAVAKALRDVPEANGAFIPSKGVVVSNDSVDISVAVATPGGLITPIVKDADKKGLSAINAEVKDLAGRGRAGKLAPEEYQGGTFTVSNLGMFGISDFTAVINPPQACILAVGAGRQEAVLASDVPTGGLVGGDAALVSGAVQEEDMAFVTKMAVQLSGDRRVVDEPVAGQFIAAFRHYMENPVLLMA